MVNHLSSRPMSSKLDLPKSHTALLQLKLLDNSASVSHGITRTTIVWLSWSSVLDSVPAGAHSTCLALNSHQPYLDERTRLRIDVDAIVPLDHTKMGGGSVSCAIQAVRTGWVLWWRHKRMELFPVFSIPNSTLSLSCQKESCIVLILKWCNLPLASY